MDIGKTIVEWRVARNLSQRALAEKVAIRQATLSAIENGGAGKLATARRILLALDMDLEVVSLHGIENAPALERKREIARVREQVDRRRKQLQSLPDNVSASQIRLVRNINKKTNTGYLAELWDDFLQLEQAAMQKALDAERFKGMAWQSLLQANPFIVAGSGSWG